MPRYHRFTVRYNTMLVLLYRPSPQVPEPSLEAASLCFDAAKSNLYVQRQQILTKAVDLTWIFTQSLFMALNTIIWTLSYPDIRKEHSRTEVEGHLHAALDSIYLASERWPGVESALELYDTLIQACLKVYNGSTEKSYVLDSHINKSTSDSPPDVATPPPMSTLSTVHKSFSVSLNNVKLEQGPSFGYIVDRLQEHYTPPRFVPAQPMTQEAPQAQDYLVHQHEYNPRLVYPTTTFDPASWYNPLPTQEAYFSADPNQAHYLGLICDQYSQCLQAPLDYLDLEQQSELMNTLETDGLGDIVRSTQHTSNSLHQTTHST